jgi:hypothetical protein
MMICPKCLMVYPTSIYVYCYLDGTKTIDTSAPEANCLKKRMKK